MPEEEIKKRGGAKRYRTIKKGGKLITIAVVPEAGPHGGHTIGWESSRKPAPHKRVKRGKK